MSSSTTVFVSGASGFIAQTLVKQLIEKVIKLLVLLDPMKKVIP